MEYTVESSTIFKQGTGTKGPWTIYKLTLQNDPQEPTGFDYIQPGERVTLTTAQTTGRDGKVYQNLNYKKVEAPASQPAPAQSVNTPAPASNTGNSDPRVVKLLVAIAEQMGIDKNQILTILS